MKISRRKLLGVLGLGLFASGTVAKVVAEEKKIDVAKYLHEFDYTELYMSKEAMEDIKNWNVYQIDEVIRQSIFSHG